MRILPVFIVLLVTLTSCQTKNEEMKATFEIPDGHAAIFGYGSLTSIKSMERTLGKTYDGAYLVADLNGYERAWNVFVENQHNGHSYYYISPEGDSIYPEKLVYLNIQENKGVVMNGVVFIVDSVELAAFDKREFVYDRIDITDEIGRVEVQGGRVYAYLAKPEFIINELTDTRKAAIRKSYAEILETAFENHGPGFESKYKASTIPYPETAVIEDIKGE